MTGIINGLHFSVSNSTGATFGRNDCDDSHGRPVAPSTLTINKRDQSFLGFVNGTFMDNTWVPGYRECKANNYLPELMRNQVLGHNSLPERPAASADMAKLLARTNPSRPDYVPLDIMQDLVDVPKMLKEAGSFLRKVRKRKPITDKDIANQHLALSFGWLPLIQDLKDLLDVNQHVQRRLGELERLYSGPGLKRRVKLGNWHASSGGNVVVNSDSLCYIVCRSSKTTTSQRWGSVRWKVLPQYSYPGYRPEHALLLQEARKTVSGFTTAGLFEGAWDLLPWSFLIDWGVNVKDYVLQYANQIPAYPTDQCVMTETSTIEQWSKISVPKGYTYQPGFSSLVTKERYVGSGTLSPHIPILDMGRLQILRSLFVQRFR